MTRYTRDNTEGCSAAALATLNVLFGEAVYLPAEALASMSDIEIKSWHDHCADRVLADFNAGAED